jgi:predicted nucleotidyltransferase
VNLVGERPDVVRVILFGSLARGDHGPRSDADVLVVLRSSEQPRFFDRIPDLLGYFMATHVPVDVLPYTESELERMARDGNPLIRRALSEGIVLASA